MRRLSAALLPAAGLVAFGLALWLWGADGAERLAAAAAEGQREAQNALARALRALRAGEPGALVWLWGLCFAYGVLHAAGPGHGKLVIGAVGLGRRLPFGRLAGLALASSAAQAGTAILLVLGGAALLGLTHQQLTDASDRWLAAVSALLIAAIGVWLLCRGLRRLARTFAGPGVQRPARQAGHGAVPAPTPAPPLAPAPTLVLAVGAEPPGVPVACADCGHVHGPTAEQVAAVGNWREALAIVLAIAARPCTGALFLLLLTWRMEILAAGIVGALAMALGTALVTIAVAGGSVALRESALLPLARGSALARGAAAAEMLAGALVLAIGLALLGPGP